jgi:hypothetical protein
MPCRTVSEFDDATIVARYEQAPRLDVFVVRGVGL